ncbi:ribose 5-phosphate isomerase B [bacterium]|nr:MAG: ribose 5-phosphate isomerase B [bacterium]
MLLIASDHGGFEAKEAIKRHLESTGETVVDLGTTGTESVDYPDFAVRLARRVSEDSGLKGILICGTGIGMSIAANKVPGVRAALVADEFSAKMAKEHNDANVIVIGGRTTSTENALKFVNIWRSAAFEGGRHEKRIAKIADMEGLYGAGRCLGVTDPDVFEAIQGEVRREEDTIVLIASENYASEAVMQAQGSVFTNKYAEGYPGARYYGGCEYSDRVERLAIERAKLLFGADHANVQPISGSAANMAAYYALLGHGDSIVSMSLAHGGHLTHGAKVSFSGRQYSIFHYGVESSTGIIDYDKMETLVREAKPRMVVAGASSYSRTLDFPRFRKIADSVGAYLMVDMAHIAGLVAGGSHPSPVPHADIVTSTTHKTLRGPRGGLVLCRSAHAAAVDKAVFPGLQGGPLVHTIAAKAVAFREAMGSAFKEYGSRIVTNAQSLAENLKKAGFEVVSGGTDNHLFLLDLSGKGLTGDAAEKSLDRAGITVNKNAVPYDKLPPTVTSGIRIGTPIVTTRGMGVDEMDKIASLIIRVLENVGDAKTEAEVRGEVLDLCRKFPFYSHLMRAERIC